MKPGLAVLLASVYGLTIRILFGFLSEIMQIMGIVFLALIPAIVGFVTIYLMPVRQLTSKTFAFFMPWVTSLILLVVTILLNIEGAICWIMIFPFFAVMAGFGGLIAFEIKKKQAQKNAEKNDWEKPTSLQVSLLFMVPVLLGFIEGERSLVPKEMTIRREVSLDATSKEVWKQIIASHETLPSEPSGGSMSNLMGFPRHSKTTLDTAAVNGKRIAYYEKGLYFEETISQYEPAQKLVLAIKTDPHKIPPTVMDEHILIGGKHLDILEDVYELETLSDGRTRLLLSSRFYINTPFNWYAGIWAEYLMKDILQNELDRIEQRILKSQVRALH
ncbi:hypothetical protein QNI19_30480 [Cytophagaceae bacterium DM2B3-1]|uniref:Polyketide cyclase n=1 Tax=Xanthocytophaga flava TaxID=3048013 RepID=A0ABT7CXH1_9BACT|nr:hypothetical protein [Xanthocytophaga flavus]MDJ1497304.1 hypothetical protein [Xanthocytophaga flavus]